MSDAVTSGPRSSTSYDDVPYESTSFPQTHPDRLATLATLFGLRPAPVDGCRVLELGCAMGANLVPMAFHLPGSEFVGVDASGRQVAAARDAAADLGLSNLRIEHASILDVDRGWGEFDYLICHGVYSWVPEPVQEKILAIAAENLAPHGIAFVSYNTYPGWHMREMVRRMMRYHVGQFVEIPERIEQARALLDFLAGSVDTTSYYGALLQSELKLVKSVRDSYLFHEHLEEINSPLYFHEFVARADRHGLRYLAEADFSTMLASGFATETAETLRRISPDIVRAEQYMDFLRNRYFRQTLLCRAEHQPRRRLEGNDLDGLLLASPVIREDASDEGAQDFRMPDGRQVATEFPLTRTMLSVLGERWPVAVDQAALRALARDRLGSAPGDAQLDEWWGIVLQDVLHCYSSGAVELRTWQAPCANLVSERPRVSRLAAQQVRTGSVVTSQRHEPVALDFLERHLIPLLDGTRDRDGLVTYLEGAVERGELDLKVDGQPVAAGEESTRALGAVLDRTLASFARRALLVG